MGQAGIKGARAKALIAVALRGELSEAQARELYRLGPEAVTLALLAAARRIADLQARLEAPKAIEPSTPSGQLPPYAKPSSGRRRRKRAGAKVGHEGHRRAAPPRIDRRVEHRLERCPECGGALQRCRRVRTRLIEDLPETLRTEVTEHTIHRDYCPRCRRHIEPVVADALPHAAIGHRLVSMTSWFHYGLGVTIDQILSILGYHLNTRLTAGGLVAAWQRLAEILEPWYHQIAQAARASAVLHADETGSRVDGRCQWLWCFACRDLCYYLIDPSRGEPALRKFFTEAFDGVLVRDFWAAYDAVLAGDHQCCLVHLLRELEKVDQRNASDEWKGFAKTLRRLVHDGIRLRKRADFTPARYAGLIRRIDRRLLALAQGTYLDGDAARLAARLDRHRDNLFTFLDRPEVPYENNFAERMIRPAVVLRKNHQSNRSQKGAATQALLMSVYQTLKLRGHDPTQTITHALRTYLQTGSLPPLPAPTIADG
ncbi:MAG: IS66 family transposase [Candidatus Sumerlaeota bacterium]|nr:IS66 family transposase [Candidatus Sumerlaeota bacterium]